MTVRIFDWNNEWGCKVQKYFFSGSRKKEYERGRISELFMRYFSPCLSSVSGR